MLQSALIKAFFATFFSDLETNSESFEFIIKNVIPLPRAIEINAVGIITFSLGILRLLVGVKLYNQIIPS
jgi:hypothetical protein